MTNGVSKDVVNRGHFDVTFQGTEFHPTVQITETTGVWASATEIDQTNDPISGGAHVTVQQVVPAKNNSATVRVWVDNVPVAIKVRVTLFVQ